MASDDLAIAHLRRFSIPVHYDSGDKKNHCDRDDSQNEDIFGHNESRRHRRKKPKKKAAILTNGDTENNPKGKAEDGGKSIYDTEDHCTEGESTCKEVTAGESPEDDKETPHRRLKIDKTYTGARRRSSGSSGRRKSHPNTAHRRTKQKPVLPPSPDESNDNGVEEELKFQLDETDIVYQADVSRTYESVSDYVQSDVALLDTNCTSTFHNGYKRPRKKQYVVNQTSNLELKDDDVNSSRLKFALKIHLCFRSLGMMTHGVVAGLAVAQCIFVFSYSTRGRNKVGITANSTRLDEVLMGNYSQVAVLFQSLYYLFLAISIVSILDRFINIDSDWAQLLQFIIAKPLRAVTLISYLLSFIFSVSLAELDGIVSTYKSKQTDKTTRQLNTWKVLNMFRVVTSIVGWVSVAFSPLDDITSATIENVLSQREEEEQDKQLQCNANSSPVPSLQ